MKFRLSEKFSLFPLYALLSFCEEISSVTDGFPRKMLLMQGLNVFLVVRLNKLFHKQSSRRWFERS